MFREMLDRQTPRISKHQDCRPGLPAGLRLAITLRFLATGDSYHRLAFSFRVSHSTISLLVREVCREIVNEYKDEVLAMPTAPDGWKEIASLFSRRWNYHHCLGAIDGKRIRTKKPKQSGSAYYNYKKVQVGKDQEKAQSEKDSHSKNRGGKKPNQQSGTYTMKTFRKPNEQLFSQ